MVVSLLEDRREERRSQGHLRLVTATEDSEDEEAVSIVDTADELDTPKRRTKEKNKVRIILHIKLSAGKTLPFFGKGLKEEVDYLVQNRSFRQKKFTIEMTMTK